MMFRRIGFLSAFVILAGMGVAPRAEARTAIVLVCGNAFGHCSSSSLVPQMRSVLNGIPARLFPVTWGGVKWNTSLTGPGLLQERPLLPTINAIARARRMGFDKIIVAGQSAGGWAAAFAGILMGVDGIVSYYGAFDLARLWQRGQWGKLNSPRGPLLLLMPWGIPGCSNCNNPFPAGDGPAYFYDVNNPLNPANGPAALQLLAASPWYYFQQNSPPMFVTQGSEDGIIGQYQGVSQAAEMVFKNGTRPQDAFVWCSGVGHGYPFNAGHSCLNIESSTPGSPRAFLRNWLQAVIAK